MGQPDVPDVPGGAGASADGFPWMATGIAALAVLAVVALVVLGIHLSRKGRLRATPTIVGIASVAALALIAAALYFTTDLFRSGDSGNSDNTGKPDNPGGNTTIEGYYTRQDLVDPSMGSAWYFDSATGTATYYAYWEPGTCDFFEPGSGSYSLVDGDLLLAGVWEASLSGDGRSFVLDEPGMWSGDPSEGIAGPNMTVVNGPSGTYVETSGCSAP